MVCERLNVGGAGSGWLWFCLVHCPCSIVPGMVLFPGYRVLVPVPGPGMALSLYKGVALLFQVEQGKAVLGL